MDKKNGESLRNFSLVWNNLTISSHINEQGGLATTVTRTIEWTLAEKFFSSDIHWFNLNRNMIENANTNEDIAKN